MDADIAPLVDIAFEGRVIHWRGPSPFFFVRIPERHFGEVSHAARLASYGWGCVPVEARIGDVDFRSALFPKDEGYLLPLKTAVRKAANLALGDDVQVEMRIYPKAAMLTG